MTLKNQIDQFGRFPPVEVRIKALAGSGGGADGQRKDSGSIVLTNFISYQYDSSILIPVDTFSFTFAIPDDTELWSDYFREGDIAQLFAGGQLLATGLIDQVEVDTDEVNGMRITVTGRDLLGILEDQEMVNPESKTIFGEKVTIDQAFQYVRVNTRIPGLRKQQTADIDAWNPPPIFATSPGESKLAALSRYVEPLNCIFWSDPDGKLVIGRPNMAQDISGTIVVDHKNRWSNCIAIKASFASAQIPNVIVPVWVGSQVVQDQVVKRNPEQALKNLAFGPARLLSLNHRITRAVVVSNPTAENPQGFADLSRFRAGGANVLQAYAKREIARQNVKELMIQVTMPGHLDNDGNPYRPDRTFVINYPRAIAAPFDMYCCGVQYKMDGERGQITNLTFVKKGTIVADVRVQQ